MDWCETASSLSPASCTRSFVDQHSCAWYHGVWPFLRAADLVSSPTWHDDFYRTQIARALPAGSENTVLVSGTADFSMVAYAIAASPRVIVADLCRTPLEASQWYARRVAAEIEVTQADFVREHVGARNVGLILSDALLTRFTPRTAAVVVRKWADALAPGGSVLTTVRLESAADPAADLAGRKAFADRFRDRLDNAGITAKIPAADLMAAVRVYTEKMTSTDLGDAAAVLGLIENAGLSVSHQEISDVAGEFSPTRYLRLAAVKPLGRGA